MIGLLSLVVFVTVDRIVLGVFLPILCGKLFETRHFDMAWFFGEKTRPPGLAFCGSLISNVFLGGCLILDLLLNQPQTLLRVGQCQLSHVSR